MNAFINIEILFLYKNRAIQLLQTYLGEETGCAFFRSSRATQICKINETVFNCPTQRYENLLKYGKKIK